MGLEVAIERRAALGEVIIQLSYLLAHRPAAAAVILKRTIGDSVGNYFCQAARAGSGAPTYIIGLHSVARLPGVACR